jgi:hypothetical protein
MKKHFFTISAIVAVSFSITAQNGNSGGNANAQWRINGNSSSTSDFIGTTNNQSLIFKTNNVERALFDTQGRTIFDGGGEVIIHPGGLNRPILNNPIAAYMLKVGGSGHFDGELNSKQLFVQEYITFMKFLKGPRIDVDTIRMDSTRGIYGQTKVFGNLELKQNLSVDGNTTLKGNLIAEKGFTFDNTNGVTYSNINGSRYMNYGNSIGLKPTVSCAAAPYGSAQLNHSFGGWLQVYSTDATGNYDPGSGLLNFQTWTGGSSIDASIGGQTGQGGLLLNYFCGNNTFINTGVNGGTVYLGKTIVGNQTQKTGFYTNALMTINGTMVAKEILVTQQNWADYVFASDYKLPKLQDIEKYYLANKHLPEIPSEKEIIENGVNVVEMEIILLKKIEELTLYMVEQKKQSDKHLLLINNLSNELNKLKDK